MFRLFKLQLHKTFVYVFVNPNNLNTYMRLTVKQFDKQLKPMCTQCRINGNTHSLSHSLASMHARTHARRHARTHTHYIGLRSKIKLCSCISTIVDRDINHLQCNMGFHGIKQHYQLLLFSSQYYLHKVEPINRNHKYYFILLHDIQITF